MPKKPSGKKGAASSEVLAITHDSAPETTPYIKFTNIEVSGGLKKGDKGKGIESRNDLYVMAKFVDEGGVLYTMKTEVHNNVDPANPSHFTDNYYLGLPETIALPLTLKLFLMDADEKGSDDNLGNAAVEIEDMEGSTEPIKVDTKGTFKFDWEVLNLEKEFIYEFVPKDPEPPRLNSPIVPTSTEAKYLEEKVWPTLEPAMERLLNALKYHMDPKDIDIFEGGWNDDSIHRVSRPELAQNFDPIAWLAQYLEWHNPNVPSRFTEDSAAIMIQCAVRKFKAKQELVRLKAEFAARKAAVDLERLRNKSATIIQACYRGHCVRLTLRLGRFEDL